MSERNRDSFLLRIGEIEDALKRVVSVKKKTASNAGYVGSVTYDLQGGVLEFLCGPPEYHVEMFLSVARPDGSLDRYDLAKLMLLPSVRRWVSDHKPDMSHGDRLKAEIDWYVSLLGEAKSSPELAALTRIPPA